MSVWGETAYKPDTIYKAVVNIDSGVYRIYFLFSNSHKGGKCVSIGEGIHTGPEWSVYHIATATDVYHTCNEGTWMMHIPEGCYPTWSFRQWGVKHSHKATISLVNEEPEFKGRHYDAIIMDDMPSKSTTPEEAKKVISWYKSMKEVRESMGDKALFHVILFNRKTEVIDFKDYIPAASETDACMIAAQKFGKYDSDTHIRVVKHIVEYKVKD